MRHETGSTPGSAGEDVSRLARRLWLAGILAVGLALRVYRLSWGLPDFIPPDSLNYFIRPAARLVAAAEFIPPSFAHTPLFVYTIGLVDFAWSHTVGEPIDLSPRPLQKGLGGLRPSKGRSLLGSQELSPQLTELILLARGFCALAATLSIAVVYLVARRLAGTRAALFAAAAFAFCPLHVLESHRVNADGVTILLALLTAHRAVVADQTRSRRGLLAAFAIAGVTGAMRYNGLAIITVPMWTALRWPAKFRERARLLLSGIAIASATVAVGLLPVAFGWQRFERVFGAMAAAGFAQGGNIDLSGGGWIYTRYVYQLAVTLPYSMGWALYLCALAGLLVLAKSKPRSLGVVLAAVVPFFLVQGAALAVEHRYYQFLLPFLALPAGVALDELMVVRKRIGIATAAVVLGYTAALSGSQCLRLGLGPQQMLAAFIDVKAREASAAGRTLGMAYPGGPDLLYDPIRTQIQNPTVRLRYVPFVSRRYVRESSEHPPSQAELTRQVREWVVNKDIDVILLPSWQENIVRRSGRNRTAARFYDQLARGTFGFRPVAEFRSRFFTEGLYTWADPMLSTHRATGILGYKVFVKTREGPNPGLGAHEPNELSASIASRRTPSPARR